VHALDDSLINDNNRLFVEEDGRPGYLVEQFPVNREGLSRPRAGVSQSSAVPTRRSRARTGVQLPRAERAGVEVLTRAEVLRIAPDRTLHVRVAERPRRRQGVGRRSGSRATQPGPATAW